MRIGLRALVVCEALEPQHEAERRRNHGQREGSDQDVIRPRFHSINSGTLIQLAASEPSFFLLSMIFSENRFTLSESA